MDDRGISPVIEKVLTAAIVVAFVATATTLFLSGVIPEYRTAAGAELADRTLASVGHELEAGIAAGSGTVEIERTVATPATIKNAGYEISLEGNSLRLDHPAEGIGASSPLRFGENITVRESTVDSGDSVTVRVQGPPTNRTITLREADP